MKRIKQTEINPLETAEGVLLQIREQLAERAPGENCAEVIGSRVVMTELVYEFNQFSLLREVVSQSLGIKVIEQNCKGIAAVNSLAADDLSEAIDEVFRSVDQGEPDEAEGISPGPVKHDYRFGTDEPDREAMFGLLYEFLEQAKKQFPALNFRTVQVKHFAFTYAYLNTNGVCFTERQGHYSWHASFAAQDGERVSSFNGVGDVFSDTEKPLLERPLVRQTLAETVQQLDAVPTRGKWVGDLILTPHVVAEFVAYAEHLFLSNSALITGSSIWRDRLGHKVASDLFTLSSEPLNPELIYSSPTTGDGYLAEDQIIIEKGILKSFLLSRYGSKKTGLERAGNTNGNWLIGAGNMSYEELIRTTERGILLNRFSGNYPSADGDFSGVAKNSFLIENGEIKTAITETMIAGNLADLLLQIDAISLERINDGSTLLPWIRARGVIVSGCEADQEIKDR